MNAPDLLTIVKESSTVFWSARDARERKILTSAGVALMLCLIYAIFFGPALSGRAQLDKDLPALRQQAAELQTLSKRAMELKNIGALAPPPISQESITTALVSRGMKPQSLTVTDNLVRVQLNPVSFAGLLDWIAEQQKTSRLAVVDANFLALAQTDMVNASLTLRQQGSGEKSE